MIIKQLYQRVMLFTVLVKTSHNFCGFFCKKVVLERNLHFFLLHHFRVAYNVFDFVQYFRNHAVLAQTCSRWSIKYFILYLKLAV